MKKLIQIAGILFLFLHFSVFDSIMVAAIVHDSSSGITSRAEEVLEPSLSSYNFFPKGKTWTSRYYSTMAESDMPEEHVKSTVVGDTVVNGKKAARLIVQNEQSKLPVISVMMEENGVVYSYNEQSSLFEPLMDFNVKKGDRIRCWRDGKYTDSYLDVLSVDYPLIRGEERKMVTIGDVRSREVYDYWIWGIGSTKYEYITIYERPTNGMVTELESCYEDGECIYSIDDLKDIVAETEMFREDLRWNYWIGSSSMGRLPTITSIRYDGTTEYGGLTYHRLVNNYRLNSYGVEESFGRRYWVESGKPVLVRKAGAKIYARFPKDWSESWKEDDKDYATEYQLVDFDCRAGETFKGLSDCGIIDVEVIREENVRIGENEARALVVIPHYPVYSLPTAERRNASSSSAEEEDEEEEKEIRIIEGVGIEGTYGFSYIGIVRK